MNADGFYLGKYATVYKCRLCGKEKLIESSARGIIFRFEITNNEFGVVYSDNGKHDFFRYTEHFCDDGSFGLADFQGFMRIDDGENACL